MRFRPLRDRILVRRVEEGDRSTGGVIIPDSAKEKPSEGDVVAVGSGRRENDGSVTPLDVAIGDRVLFGKHGGSDVVIDGEKFLVLKESDVLGIAEFKAKSKKAA